jgi:UDP-glucose 4-epimerase
MKNKMLVTGGAGFIGSHLVDKLIEQGHEVIVIDNESGAASDKFYWNDKATRVKKDIVDYEGTRPFYEGVDYVFHLAAKSRIQTTVENPVLCTETNLVGTTTVLKCSKEAGVKRVIYSSTSSAYGLKNIPPLREDMPEDCLNPYSISKTAGEKMCKFYTDCFGLETTTFRYFNVYGKREPLKGPYAPVVGIFMRQRKAGEPMTIVGDGEQRRDFTHVDDVVEANIRAAYAKGVVGEIINVGTGTNHSVNELADMVGGPRVTLPQRPGEARITLADNSKLKNLLKLVPQVKVEEHIKLIMTG